MDIKASIEDTRKGFEESFASGDFYNRQTQDAKHLERILAFINVRDGMRILDLGCGSGYLTFPIAERNPYLLLNKELFSLLVCFLQIHIPILFAKFIFS